MPAWWKAAASFMSVGPFAKSFWWCDDTALMDAFTYVTQRPSNEGL